MIQLSIGDVREHAMSAGEHEVPGCLVLLEEEEGGDRLIPIWIDMAEAQALVQGMRGLACPRPLMHDLTAGLLHQLGAKLTEVRITDWRDQTFYAILTVRSNGSVHELDCRPSDGMCLAVCGGAPGVVTEELMARVGQQNQKPLTGSGIETIAAQSERSLSGRSPQEARE